VDEQSKTDALERETDGFTYAVDEDGDLLWFIPPSAYRRRGPLRDSERSDGPEVQKGPAGPHAANERLERGPT
jgi:hypothetical protein